MTALRGRCSRAGLAPFLLMFLLALASCGYRLENTASTRYLSPGTSIDLRPFLNRSLMPDAGAFVADRLREEMVRGGFRGGFSRFGAAVVVDGTVAGLVDDVVSTDAAGFGLEHRLTINVSIRVVDVSDGRVLWKEEGLADAVAYFAGPDFQATESNRRVAFEELARRMARRLDGMLKVAL